MINNFQSSLEACILSKLIAGQSVNSHTDKLTGDYHDLADAILAVPPIPTQRTQAFETALVGMQDADQIRLAVFAADPGADLDNFKEVIDIRTLPLTDAGNAETLAALHGDKLRYDHRRNRWLIWNEQRWEPDKDGYIDRLAMATTRERLRTATDINDPDKRKASVKWAIGSENRSRQTALIAMAQSLHPITDAGELWDSDHWLLGCANGVVDLTTGQLRPGKPSDMITMSTGLNYDPEAKAERFTQFLQEIFNGDAEVIEFVQRAAGHCLTGDTREEIILLCWGKGSNGKTTLLNALRNALGEYSANTPFSTFEQTKTSQTNDVAALYGKRFVTASETSESKRLNEERVKAMTGKEPLTVRFLFGEYFTFNPTFKVWLAMNHKPTISGVDDGIWRRIRLIPFTVSFEGHEDNTLWLTLEKEKEGILTWMVQGALKWQAGGLAAPAIVKSATKEYRQESDIIAQFLAECTIQKEAASVTGGMLYQAFAKWCKDNGEKETMTGTAFGRSMKDRGIDSVRKSGHVWYLDIGLLSNEENTEAAQTD